MVPDLATSDYRPRIADRLLESKLASAGDFPLVYDRQSKAREWVIDRKAFMEYLNSPNQEGELDELCPF
jgi:hypothetical protein